MITTADTINYLESEISLEYERTPELLDSTVETWHRINPRQCQLVRLLADCKGWLYTVAKFGDSRLSFPEVSI